MARSPFYFLAAALLVALPGTGHPQNRDDLLSRYRLGSGDVISISVLGEDDLKRDKVRLTDAGTIQFPVQIKKDGETTVRYRVRYTW